MSEKKDERGEKLITAARRGDLHVLLVSSDFGTQSFICEIAHRTLSNSRSLYNFFVLSCAFSIFSIGRFPKVCQIFIKRVSSTNTLDCC